MAADAPSGSRIAFTPDAMAAGELSALCTLRMARWQATSDEEHAVLVGMQGPGRVQRGRKGQWKEGRRTSEGAAGGQRRVGG